MPVFRTADAILAAGRTTLRRYLARGLWQQPCRGVVVTHNGPLSDAERLDVALASAPPGSALAGPTALQLDGLTGFDDETIHVVIPRGGRHPSMPGLDVHVSRELSILDVHPHRQPTRTRAARSAIDFASWQRTDRRARAIIIATMQQGLTNTRGIREALTRRGPCRHRALIVESVLDAAGGIQSLPERDFRNIWARSGLPRLTHQERVRGRNGNYYLDAYCAELGFGIEVHGIPHLGVQRWTDDLARGNEIVIGGNPVLQFTSYAIRHAPAEIIDQLRRMATSRGWRLGPSAVRRHPKAS
jgi:very-short-patch-repair endonuclease